MSTREAVIESLQGHTVTSFKGRKPTATDVDTLEKELAAIASTVKTNLFPEGSEHGHLCCVLPNEAYGRIIGDPNYEFETPEAPEPYNPDIDNTTGDLERKTMEAEWERHKADYQRYLGVQEALRTLIVSAVSETYLRPLKNEYSGYTQYTARRLIDQIITKVKLTEKQKAAMMDQIDFDWDQTEDFSAYIDTLELIQRRSARWGVNITEDQLIKAAIKQVYKCNVFTREHRKMWDDLDDEEKDWGVFKEHFIEKYDEEVNYDEEETAGRGGLQGVHGISEKGEDVDQLTEYLYGIEASTTASNETIQQVNDKTLTVVKELTDRIKTLTETVANQQKTIASQQFTIAKLAKGGGGGGGHNNAAGADKDKETPKPPREKRLCANCHLMVGHQDKNCPELPNNTGKRYKGWKSVFAGMKNPHYGDKVID